VWVSREGEIVGRASLTRTKGKEISVQARILAVVDVFDALTAADRPYRRAIPLERAGEIHRAEAKDGRLDKDIVDLFLDKGL